LSKVLDNATLVDGSLKATVDGAAAAAPTLSGTALSWTGVLEPGKSVVLTYQVKVNAGVAGGTLINNKVTGIVTPGNCFTFFSNLPAQFVQLNPSIR
ncbi:hypothetical protein, partial [Rhodococcus sp. C3V]|uniref:DUF7927 domain-containing protein n=1 Tax=Rhodococcus sp. C3V TaxID=3034165 RepID=UPI0023E246A4